MREIKFRAWDNEVKKMYTFDGSLRIKFFKSGRIGVLTNRNDGNSLQIRKSRECTIMQYTGLKDKNGVEIFEKDTVKHPYKFGNGNGIVSYFAPRFLLEWKGNICDEIDICECEVIGNIYQEEK